MLKISGRIIFVFLLSLTIFLSGCEKTSEITNKVSCKGADCYRELAFAIQDLSKIEIPQDSENIENYRQRIYSIVDRFSEPQHIATLALLSKSMLNTCADVTCSKESKLEPTFDNAFWYSVKVLAKNKQVNKEVLDNLKHLAVLNGTQNGEWGKIVDGKEFP